MTMSSEFVNRHQIAFALGKWLASFIQLVDETSPGAVVSTETFVEAVRLLRMEFDGKSGTNREG